MAIKSEKQKRGPKSPYEKGDKVKKFKRAPGLEDFVIFNVKEQYTQAGEPDHRYGLSHAKSKQGFINCLHDELEGVE